MIATRILSFIFLVSAGGCLMQSCTLAATSEVNDLRLLNVEVVSQKQIPSQDKYWGAGVITSPLFRISFTSKENLEEIAKGGNYNIDNVTSICRDASIDQDRVLKGFPSVLDSFGRVDSFRPSGTSAPAIDKGTEIEYHVYFEPKQAGIQGFYPYDLSREPSDICITVDGVQEIAFMIGRRFASNTLVVPRAAISAAIVEARKRGLL